jgi:PAS domain S-box-containing protein
MTTDNVCPLIRQFADRLSDPVCILSKEGALVYHNPAYLHAIGQESPPFEHLPFEDRELWLEAFHRAGESPQTITTRLQPLKGPYGIVRWDIFRLDTHVAVILHYASPTGMKEANALFSAIVDSSDDAIVSKTLNSIVTSWNQGAERIFGYTSDEMLGESITKLIPPDRLGEEDAIIDQLRQGSKVDHFETVRLTKDGRLIDVSVTISPIRNGAGEIVGASKVARVITERKLAELALKESERHLRGLTELLEQRVQDRTADLQAALREMEGFTYTISHDLRAPLRAIIANCRLLEEDYGSLLPATAHRHLQRQTEAARKLATLIDDLLRLSRIGRQALHRVEVDLSAMADEIASEMAGPTFRVARDLRVQADPLLLRLALGNLFENAVKFARTDVEPIVEFGATDGVFFIRDNGIGFDPTYSERIFLPFERLHRDVEYPGTGIGLANVRRIVERHGGKVWATSTPNEGSTFSFRIPDEGEDTNPTGFPFQK